MRNALCSFVLVLLCAAASAEDLTITSKVTRDGQSSTATSYVSNDRIRMTQGDGNEMIFDMKSGDITVLENRKKTYYVMTRKDFDEMSAMIKERMNSPEMKQAQEQMKNMPPEQQKQMQKMMGGMFDMQVEKSGGGRTIAGYHCENWTVNIGQFSKSVQCMTTDLKLPVQTWDAFKSLSDSMRSMMAAMGPMASGMDTMRSKMEKLKGFPLANTTTTSIMGHTTVTTTEVTSISRGAIPASAWEIPAGYTKVDNPMKKAMMGGRR